MRFKCGLAKLGNETDALASLVADAIWPNKGYDFGSCRAIAVVDEYNNLAAGLVYHNWFPDEKVIEISGAAWKKGWLTRSVLGVMYGFPFKDCGCDVVVQRVSDDDKAQHRMLKAYGAEHYRIPNLRGLGKAENVFVLTKEAWLNNRFNKREGISHG